MDNLVTKVKLVLETVYVDLNYTVAIPNAYMTINFSEILVGVSSKERLASC
jgi:hypothetical protein